ncbi:protein ITPRID2 isoform X2 [Cyclopterus lumpus]|uniref:protein ITPRID2 isoform X2 n=1 Tax=Cyclopterus lumpus TaxID=8103 RepID=UPI001486C21B|nr:protein ITPRID2 isoform X2 [Cyclopterus lumpus]
MRAVWVDQVCGRERERKMRLEQTAVGDRSVEDINANHLQSSNSKAESCFGLAADQKRSQYKERARSMNSTGSGKSSTVSSVSELLDLYEEDPEEILLNLGFGREEPDLASKVPSRFFSNFSTARGIDIKVYLGAQLQRMEVENPNYALTSRFRQIEVLTTVANEFFNLYSQVSGQPVQCISSKDPGGEGGDNDSATPPPRRRNVAKLLKKITKHNLLAAATVSLEEHTPDQQTQMNGHATSDQTNTNAHTHVAPEQEGCSIDPDHQAETVNQNHMRKKDSCHLATVAEETNADGDDSSEQSRTGPASNGEHQPESADSQSPNGRTEEGTQMVKEEQVEEKILTSTPEKAPPTLAPLQLAQLRIEKTDSFDMEEIQSNEDEALPLRTSRGTDLLRTASQQSDSSGFAEEPSADSNSYLKVQESSDSCDSETTVTSHPSLDVATPLAMDQPAFELPDSQEEEAEPAVAAEADERSSSRGEDKHDGSSEQVPQFTAQNGPMGTQQGGTGGEEQVEGGHQTDPDPEQETFQSMFAVEQEPQSELVHTQNRTASEQESEHTQNPTETATDIKPPTEVGADDEAQEENAFLSDSDSLCPTPGPSSPVLNALNRAKQKELSWGEQWANPQSFDMPKLLGGRRRRRGITLQRSSSLPSTLLSPSRIVSSVRIQFGQGQASCSKPRYSFKYTCDGEDEEEEEEGQNNCLSTLIINPAPSSYFNNQPPRLPRETPIPPKPIPRYLMRSTCSLHSCSPPPDAHFWSTQSVPDLSSNRHQPGMFQQNMKANQNQQSWNPGQTRFRYPDPTAQYANPSPNPGPSLNPSPYPFPLNPTPQYSSPPHPYASLPNHLHHHNLTHHSSLASLYQPTTPPVPQHGSLSNLHQPSTSTSPHHFNLGHLHPGTPQMHHQAYNQQYGHQSPYHATPHGSQFASPYLGNQVYNMNPHLAFPYPVTQYPPLAPEHSLHPGFTPPPPGFFPGPASTLGPGHSLHPGFTPPAPGFFPGLASTLGPGHSLHPGFTPPAPGYFPGPASTLGPGHSLHPGFTPPAPGFLPGLASSHGPGHSLSPGLAPQAAPSPGLNQAPSSTEMQLRRVLHDIKGAVQSLSQKQADTPEAFSEHRAALLNHQSLAEIYQKRQSLNLFRCQMTDLEKSIIRQQALVYKHLSPADRMEVEQLQSLRSSVREELQELEQQLEDRLMELTQHTHHRGLRSDRSFDSLSTTSALRAMEPVSDLLREQLLLQSELSYGSHTPSTEPSSRTSTPVAGEGEQKGGVYRASININPVPAPRPNTHTEEEEREEGESEGGGVPEEEGAAGGIRVGDLQQLIREIRESVAQEVRQEIYSELLAVVSPSQTPLPGRQHPL